MHTPQPPLFLFLQHTAQSTHTNIHIAHKDMVLNVQHVRLTNISVTMCFCLRTMQSKWGSLSLSLRVCVLCMYNDSLPLLSEYQQLRVLADWLAGWVASQTEWDRLNERKNHASNKTDSVRVVNGRDVTNQIKFSRVAAHRQFDGTWLAFQIHSSMQPRLERYQWSSSSSSSSS